MMLETAYVPSLNSFLALGISTAPWLVLKNTQPRQPIGNPSFWSAWCSETIFWIWPSAINESWSKKKTKSSSFQETSGFFSIRLNAADRPRFSPKQVYRIFESIPFQILYDRYYICYLFTNFIYAESGWCSIPRKFKYTWKIFYGGIFFLLISSLYIFCILILCQFCIAGPP